MEWYIRQGSLEYIIATLHTHTHTHTEDGIVM